MQKTEKSSTFKILLETFLILAIASIFFSLVTSLRYAGVNTEGGERVTPLEDGWYYMKDGVKTEVQLPVTIDQSEAGPLTLYNDSLTQDAAGMMVTTRGAQYGLRISMGDQILYE